MWKPTNRPAQQMTWKLFFSVDMMMLGGVKLLSNWRERNKPPINIQVIGVESLYPEPNVAVSADFLGVEGFQVINISGMPVIAIARSALDTAVDFAQVHTSEIGGLCLGRIFKDETDRWLVRIEAMILAEHTISHPASVTFTYDSWTHLLDVQQREFPESRLVGWFHSHPGFGIFLSSPDRFIHEHFFSTPWQVAIVIDPIQQTLGVFARSETTLELTQTFHWPEQVEP